MREIDFLLKAMNKRVIDSRKFDALVHDKELKIPSESEAYEYVELSEEQQGAHDRALENAKLRKQQSYV